MTWHWHRILTGLKLTEILWSLGNSWLFFRTSEAHNYRYTIFELRWSIQPWGTVPVPHKNTDIWAVSGQIHVCGCDVMYMMCACGLGLFLRWTSSTTCLLLWQGQNISYSVCIPIIISYTYLHVFFFFFFKRRLHGLFVWSLVLFCISKRLWLQSSV